MNRLKLMRFYLVGPMDHDREAGRPWRIEMVEWLINKKALPIDPYDKPLLKINKQGLEDNDSFKRRKEILKELEFDPYNQNLREEIRTLTKPIVHTDLRVVDNADCIICYLDKDKEPCGTFDEVFTAVNQNKPVIIMCPQKIHKIYDWFWGRMPHELFFDRWSDVKNYLTHIDSDPDDQIDLLNRWKFFDWEPLIKQVLGIS